MVTKICRDCGCPPADARKGEALADLLGLKPSKDGYYQTAWGRKTAAGLYLTVNAFLQSTEVGS